MGSHEILEIHRVVGEMTLPFNEEALGYLKEWMIERETVRLRKEAGCRRPWTENKFLQNYRFTNVRREDDKNSRWLIDNIALNPDLEVWEKIVNMLCARMYNNLNTMKSLFPFDFNAEVDLNEWDKRLANTSYLCNAYMPVNHQYAAGYFAEKTGIDNGKTPSGKPAYYRPTNLLRLGFELLERGDIQALYDRTGLDGNAPDPFSIPEYEVYHYLRGLPTMGDFMAYQHWVDLTYIPELELDENAMVVSGPGCVMGLQCLFAKELTDTYRKSNNTPDLKFPVRVAEFMPDLLLMEMQSKFSEWFPEWPFDWTPTVMSLENVCCEVHKYIKLKKGWGTPRNKYDGGATTASVFDLI